MSDIKFGTLEQIEVECSNFNIHGSDLTLDHPPNRKPNGPRLRRALVHTQGDSLTINFNRDYPGGVTVNGPLVVTGRLSFESLEQRVVLGGPGCIPTGPTPNTEIVRTQVDIQQALAALAAQIAALQAKVAKLEARP